MTIRALAARVASKQQVWPAVLLLTGFCASVGLRIAIGRPDVSHSAIAGVAFAGCLAVLTVASGTNVVLRPRTLAVGLAGSIFLCVPALVARATTSAHHLPAGNYLIWALVVSGVALAEEAFLRGAFYDAVAAASNHATAITVAAAAFAVLHIPLYGWPSVPLNFAVGLFLGTLRLSTNTFVAPGIAHALADLSGWWLR